MPDERAQRRGDRIVSDRHRRPGHAQIGAFLRSLAAPCCSSDTAIGRLRGAQAALLRAGTLVSIDLHAFAADRARKPRSAPTAATAAALRGYLEPYLAAAATIAAATGRGPERIAALTIADIDPDAVYLADGQTVQPRARGLIRARSSHQITPGSSIDKP